MNCCRTLYRRPSSFLPNSSLISKISPPQHSLTTQPPKPNSKGNYPTARPNGASTETSIDKVSHALRDASSDQNNLLSPVHIPEDPHGVLKERHPATSLLANSAIVVQRELEMMNLMIGFEQANRYVIMDPKGNHLGFMAEQEFGVGNALARQWLRTHRSFTTHVFDRNMKEVLRFHRPFSWISSRIRVYDPLEVSSSSHSPSSALEPVNTGSLSASIGQNPPQTSSLALSDMRIIGEAQQQWAPLRRKYNLFLFRDSNWQGSATQPNPTTTSQQVPSRAAAADSIGSYHQFAYVDERFLSWDFSLLSSDSRLLGSVNRNFAGFGREIFTDTGLYALRMDAASLAEEPSHLISKTGKSETVYGETGAGMSLDQRAVMLATAVSVDFDYFSRQRNGMFDGILPFWMIGGGEAAEGAAVGEAAGGAAAGEPAGSVIGRTGSEGAGLGNVGGAGAAGAMGEGAMAGAGTMAGYEAMQRGMRGREEAAPPEAGQDDYGQYPSSQQPYEPGQQLQEEEIWGEQSPRSQRGGADNSDDGGGGGGGGGDEGGDWGDWF